MRVFHQVLLLHHIQNGNGGSAGQVGAAKGGAQHAVGWLDVGCDEHACHRESVAHSLCGGDDVGLYAEVLVGKEPARAAVARLHLVKDKLCAKLLALSLNGFKEIGGRYLYSANSLDSLYNHSSHLGIHHI